MQFHTKYRKDYIKISISQYRHAIRRTHQSRQTQHTELDATVYAIQQNIIHIGDNSNRCTLTLLSYYDTLKSNVEKQKKIFSDGQAM